MPLHKELTDPTAMPSVDELRARLSYDPETGILKRRVRTQNGLPPGTVAGVLNVNGYVFVRVMGRRYQAHRVCFAIYYGRWPNKEIDHINRVKNDNRISNLREASRVENLRNKGIQSNNTSGFKGVHASHNKQKPWKALIKLGEKSIHLGYFESPTDAAMAYDLAATENHGDFASPNFDGVRHAEK